MKGLHHLSKSDNEVWVVNDHITMSIQCDREYG